MPLQRHEFVMKDAVCAAVKGALRVRDDKPSFVILLGSPGDEEIIISGINAGTGDIGVPIIGGSSGDNTVAGLWRQISKVGTVDPEKQVRSGPF